MVEVNLSEGLLRIFRPVPSAVYCLSCGGNYYGQNAQFLGMVEVSLGKKFLQRLIPTRIQKAAKYLVEYDFTITGPPSAWMQALYANKDKWKEVQAFDKDHKLIFRFSQKTD